MDRVWRLSKVDLFIVRFIYGYSSVFYLGIGCIYVYGGYRMFNSFCYRVFSEMFYYEFKVGKWY